MFQTTSAFECEAGCVWPGAEKIEKRPEHCVEVFNALSATALEMSAGGVITTSNSNTHANWPLAVAVTQPCAQMLSDAFFIYSFQCGLRIKNQLDSAKQLRVGMTHLPPFRYLAGTSGNR
jgi:c-di-GMP-binding flagellar brake protein YcgR